MRPQFFCLLLAVLALGGCAGMGGGNDQPFEKMITKDTAFYRQGTGDLVAERQVERGLRVRIIGLSGDGLLHVETISGEKGFVAQDAVGDQPVGGSN